MQLSLDVVYMNSAKYLKIPDKVSNKTAIDKILCNCLSFFMIKNNKCLKLVNFDYLKVSVLRRELTFYLESTLLLDNAITN